MDTVTIKGEKVAGQVVYIEIETTTPPGTTTLVTRGSHFLYIVLCLLEVVKRESIAMSYYIDLYNFTRGGDNTGLGSQA